MAQDLTTAIDIGSDTVKVVSLRRRRGRIEVVGAAVAHLSEQEKAAEDREAVVAGVLDRLIRKNGIRLGSTVLGLSSKGTMIRYLAVPAVPPWKLSLLMGFEVDEQMNASGGAENVAYDYRILSLPDFEEGQFPILLALAQIPVIRERMELAHRGLKRSVDDIDLLALGAFNLFRYTPHSDEDEISLLLDVGAEETHLTLQHGPHLLFARTISFGGRQMTQALQKAMGLLGPEAEQCKRERGRILPADEAELGEPDEVTISNALRAEVRNLSSMIQSSLRFFQGQYRTQSLAPAAVYVTGGGSRLDGFDSALEHLLRLPVQRLDVEALQAAPAARAVIESEQVHHLGTAMGLALGRMTGGFSTSLLPPDVKQKRRFWRRTIYAYYSGALALCLLILLGVGGCPFYGGGWRESAYMAERGQRWAEHTQQAEAAHKGVEELRQKNEKLAAQLEALEVRAQSGRDLLLALEHLRRFTAKDVFFTELNTAEIPPEAKAADADEDAPAPAAPDPGLLNAESFQKNRFIELKGYLVNASREQDARDRLVTLKDRLTHPEIFYQVSIQRTEPLLANDPEVQEAFKIRLGEENELEPPAPPRGVALAFVLRCKVR